MPRPFASPAAFRLRAFGLAAFVALAAPAAVTAAWAQPNGPRELTELCRQSSPRLPEAVRAYCALASKPGADVNADTPEMRVARGRALSVLGRQDEAVVEYDAVLAANPAAKDVLVLRAVAYAIQGHHDRTITDFEAAIRLDPKTVDVLARFAAAMHEDRHYAVEIRYLSTALAHRPDDAKMLAARGVARDASGDAAAGLVDLDGAIALAPTEPDFRLSRAIVRTNAGDDAGALSDFDAVLAAMPGDGWIHYRRGHTHFDAGRFKEAQADFAVYRRRDPANVYAALWLYLARMRAGEDGRPDLERFAAGTVLNQWPGILVELYLDRLAPEVVLDAADDSNERKERDQACEALFFIGQYFLLRGQRERALHYFQAAVDSGVTEFIEYTRAQVELRRPAP